MAYRARSKDQEYYRIKIITLKRISYRAAYLVISSFHCRYTENIFWATSTNKSLEMKCM